MEQNFWKCGVEHREESGARMGQGFQRFLFETFYFSCYQLQFTTLYETLTGLLPGRCGSTGKRVYYQELSECLYFGHKLAIWWFSTATKLLPHHDTRCCDERAGGYFIQISIFSCPRFLCLLLQDHLKKHKERIHENISYQCPKCELALNDKAHLKEHVKVTHDGFKYECSECGFQYSTSTGLRMHKKNIHQKNIVWFF